MVAGGGDGVLHVCRLSEWCLAKGIFNWRRRTTAVVSLGRKRRKKKKKSIYVGSIKITASDYFGDPEKLSESIHTCGTHTPWICSFRCQTPRVRNVYLAWGHVKPTVRGIEASLASVISHTACKHELVATKSHWMGTRVHPLFHRFFRFSIFVCWTRFFRWHFFFLSWTTTCILHLFHQQWIYIWNNRINRFLPISFPRRRPSKSISGEYVARVLVFA